MSKFFKALEKVEHERETAAAPEASAPPRAEPARVEPRRVEPRRVEPVRSEPVRSEPVRTEPARVEPVHAEPAHVEPVVSHVEPKRAEPSPFARPAARTPGYGAAIARPSNGGFAWQMDPAVDGEAGDIDDHLVSLLEPTSFAAEQYRAVRLAIETLHHERGTRVVAVSSPGRGDGKTITAINLAGALAQAPDARVVLVEADLRHPAIARALGLVGGRGLSSYLLESSMTVEDVLQRPASMAFSVLPAGATSSMPYELLKSPRLIALIAELRRRFDYVLLDVPPALPFPDVGILRDLVDGFVVVVRANRTPREALQDTMSVLGRQRTLGLVFNDDEHTGVPAFDEEAEGGWRRLVPRSLGARVA